MHYPSHSGVYTIIPALAGAYLTYSGFARQREQRAGTGERTKAVTIRIDWSLRALPGDVGSNC
jgi:hypothetical protein